MKCRSAIFIITALTVGIMLAGCFEVTEDKSTETALSLAATNTINSRVWFTADGKDYYAYSYNCFMWAYDSRLKGTGWTLSLGYPGSTQRDVKILIKADPVASSYDQTSPELVVSFWLDDTHGYMLDDDQVLNFDFTITTWTSTRATGTFSGTLEYRYEAIEDPMVFTGGTFDVCIRPR